MQHSTLLYALDTGQDRAGNARQLNVYLQWKDYDTAI
jgi:hypothetical protein